MAKSTIFVNIVGDATKLETALKAADGSLAGFGKAATALGGTMTKKMTLPLVAVGAGAVALANNFDKAYDNIRVGTGATGDKLAGLEESFKNVVKDVPASFEDASEAIAMVNTRLGLTGEPLEEVSTQMLELSRLTGTDLATNVDALTRVYGDWGISADDVADANDALFRITQSTGIGIDDLATKVVQFGSPLRNLGFTFEETASLFGKFQAEGVNTETVMAGLKQGLGNFAKAGLEPKEALAGIIEKIKGFNTVGEAMPAAIDAFGKRAAPDMVAAIREGKFELTELVDVMENGTDTIIGVADETQSVGEKLQELGNSLAVAVEPIVSEVFEGLGSAVDVVGPKIQALGEAFGSLPDPVKNTALAIAGIAAAAGPTIWAVGKMSTALSTMGDWMRKIRTLKMADVIGALNPTMIGLATAIGVATIAWKNYSDSQQKVNEAKEATAELAFTNAEAFKAEANEILRANLEQQGVLSVLDQIGTSTTELNSALAGNSEQWHQMALASRDASTGSKIDLASWKAEADKMPPAIRDINMAVIELVESGQISPAEAWKFIDAGYVQSQGLDQELDNIKARARDLIDETDNLTDAQKANATEAINNANSLEELSQAHSDYGIASDGVTDAVRDETGAIEGNTDAAQANADATVEMTTALQDYVNEVNAALNPMLGVIDANQALTDAQTEVAAAQQVVTNMQNAGTTQGAEYEQAIRDLEDANRAQTDAAWDLEQAEVALNAIVSKNPAAYDQAAGAIDRLAASGRITTGQANAMKTELFLAAVAARNVDGRYSADVDADTTGFWGAANAVEQYKFQKKLVTIEANAPWGLFRRAGGGPVAANVPYMVGERGPEMFVPEQNGMIVPNDALGDPGSRSVARMGGGVNVHFHGPVAVDAAAWVVESVEEGVRRGYQMPRLRAEVSA